MLEALRSLQSARAQAANTAQELLAELAGPQATVKLVTWLPVGVVVLAQGLGFDILGALLGNLLAQLSVIAGVVLLVVANRWSTRMVRAATPSSDDPAAGLNLFIALLKSGQSLSVARQSVDETGLALGGLLATARATGAPLVDLLDARARAIRTRIQANVSNGGAGRNEERAARVEAEESTVVEVKEARVQVRYS